MPLFLLSSEQIHGDRVRITGSDVHHIVRVLRKRPGDAIVGVLAPDTRLRLRILKVSSDEVVAEVVERSATADAGLPSARLILFQGLVRGPKMDFIIQKATELGVAAVVPVMTERSVPRIGPTREAARIARWKKIAREACKQCGRPEPPQVLPPQSVAEVQPTIAELDVALLFTPSGPVRSVAEVLAGEAPERVGTIVGPEGGFTPAEEEIFVAADAVPLCLPGYVLRTETASIAACAVLIHALFGREG